MIRLRRAQVLDLTLLLMSCVILGKALKFLGTGKIKFPLLLASCSGTMLHVELFIGDFVLFNNYIPSAASKIDSQYVIVC